MTSERDDLGESLAQVKVRNEVLIQQLEPTLAAARKQWFESTITDDGGHCPCCDRFGKMYKRKMNRTMAASLLWLSRIGGGWIDVPKTAPKWVVRTNQLSTLKWWGLIERKAADPTGKVKHTGLWRVTAEGALFAMGITTAPAWVITYNDEPIKFSDKLIHIGDALGADFDYRDVMGPI